MNASADDPFSFENLNTIYAHQWGQHRPRFEKVDEATAQILGKHVGTVWKGITRNGEAWGVLCYHQGEMVLWGLETPLAATNEAWVAGPHLHLRSTHPTTKIEMQFILGNMCDTPAKQAAVQRGGEGADGRINFATALQCVHMSDLQPRTKMDTSKRQLEPPMSEKRRLLECLQRCARLETIPVSEESNFQRWLDWVAEVVRCNGKTDQFTLAPIYDPTSMLLNASSDYYCPMMARHSDFLLLMMNLTTMMDQLNGNNCHPHAPSLPQWMRGKLLELSNTTEIAVAAEPAEPPPKQICVKE